MELGEYINNYLKAHDMSIRAFAKICGISHTYITNIVNGKTGRGTKPVLTYPKLKQIAKGMGVDIKKFLAEIDVDIKVEEQKNPTTENGDGNDALFAEMYSNFNQLPQEDKEYVVGLINRLLNGKGD